MGQNSDTKQLLVEIDEHDSNTSGDDDALLSHSKRIKAKDKATNINNEKHANTLKTPVLLNGDNEQPTSSHAHLINSNSPNSAQNNLDSLQERSAPQQHEPTFHIRSRTAAVDANARRLGDDTYESLDYEVCENELFQEEEKSLSNSRYTRKDVMRWFIFILIGIATALVACIIDIIIEELCKLKYKFLQESVDSNVTMTGSFNGDLVVSYLYWIALSIVPVAIGSILVTFVEPITAGSGMPQVKSYLNGVKIPRIVRIKTLFIKAIGVITSVVGGLFGGKEGPMIHAGAVIAAGISQGKSTTFVKDFRVFKEFRDDHEKRDFVLGGAAAGVAAAFGSPIGGMLFSMEEAASFWNQNLIWRTLVASVISSFTLNIVLSAYKGQDYLTFTGLFNLGKFQSSLTYDYFELPIFVLLGICGGLLGAMWNMLNTKINKFRSRYVKFRWAKVVEAVLIASLGVTFGAISIFYMNDCRALGNDPTDYPVQLFCEDNQYNAVAALWFQTPEATVRALFHDPPSSHKILSLAVFLIIYYVLSCFTFGLNVSLGIFIPIALIGAAWGRLVAILAFSVFPQAAFFNPGKYALIGAAANLGGVLRMTISLSVILMETTGVETSFFFPLIVTLISAKWVGDCFNEGIYDTQIEMNHVPVLPWEPLPKYMGLKASQIMSSPVVCIRLRDKAKYIYDILKRYNHNGFPVVENVLPENDRSRGRVCGIVLRSQLIVILLKSLYEEKKRFWEKDTSIQTFRDVYPRYPSVKLVRMHNDKVDYTVNLEMFMNPSPVRVNEHDSVPRIFNIFRALGLRHMLVIDGDNRIVGMITRKDFLYK